MQQKPIFLDYNSTTPVDPQVLEAMLPYFTEKFGNASSKTHSYGWIADEAVKIAREQVAKLLGCLAQEIIFTSGATEAANIAIKGVFEAYHAKGRHLVTVKTEHKAILDVHRALEKRGAEITYLNVGPDGLLDLQELEDAITEKTILVSVMYANNETGVIQDIKNISRMVHEKGAIFFCDATQAAGKIPFDVMEEGIGLLAVSGYKMYGPKGIGALYIRRKNPRVTLLPILDGGGQEKGLRPGTLNVPGIVGLGKACEMALGQEKAQMQIQALRNHLEANLLQLKGTKVNGHKEMRLPNTISITFEGLRADSLITGIKDIAISNGSACTSAIPEPSHVLMAMGLSKEEAFGSIRLSLGKYTTREEVETVARLFEKYFKK